MTSKIYTISVWIMKIVLLNFLWGLFCFPLLYVSLDLIFGDLENLKMIFTTLAVLAPFFLYPATAAIYGVARKWSMGETDIPIIRSFWGFYKENYLYSLLGGIVFTFLWVSISFNFIYLSSNNSGFLNIIYAILAVFLFAWNIQYLAFIVHYESKFIPTLKNTFILTAGAPFISVGILLIHIGVIYVTFKFPVLIILCTASLSAYLTYLLFYFFIQKMQLLKQTEETEEDTDEDTTVEEQEETGTQMESDPADEK